MDDPRFTHLMSRLLDDELKPDELAELVELVRIDPQRLGCLQEQLEVADWLAQAQDELRDGPRFVAATLARTPDHFVAGVKARLSQAPRSRRWLLAGLAAGVLAAAVFVAILMLWPGQQPLARITIVSGAVRWTADGGVESESLTGRGVRSGTLESLSVDSWAVLQYADGSTLTITGRSRLTVLDSSRKEVRLDHGRLSASVRPQPAGQAMAIVTSTARLEVLGTQLNVVSEESLTRVSVNEGRVRLTRLVDGSVAEVPADHQAVASVDRREELIATRRSEAVRVWQSQFPRDIKYGQWLLTPDDNGSVRATSLLLSCAKPKPLLIYVASCAVTGEDSSPLLLGSAGRFIVRGRVGSTAEVFFGMTMNHPRGGFAGKFIAKRKVEAKSFEWAVSLDQFSPQEPSFPATPAGLEIVDCWCLTVHDDHGLVVHSIELRR